MALFFDENWFAQKLSQRGQTRKDFSRALDMDDEALALIWKDQRALTPRELALAAQFLGVSPQDILDHAGRGALQKPDADKRARGDIHARLDEISARLEAIERILADLKHIILAQLSK